jgi:flagellar basal body-associated protein FliL
MLLSGISFANEGGGGGGGGAADLVTLEPLVINLASNHYIQFKPQLKLNDAKDMELVKAYTPVIRFALIKSMIGKDPAEVQTTKFIGEFSESGAALINKVLKDEYVKEILFDSWLIQ